MSPLLDHLRRLFRPPPPRPYTKTAISFSCRERLPERAGDYNVVVEGLSSLTAIFIYFDGKGWDEEALKMHERLGLADFSTPRTVWWFPGDPNGGPFVRGSKGAPL